MPSTNGKLVDAGDRGDHIDPPQEPEIGTWANTRAHFQFAAGVEGYSWIIAAVISVWVISAEILFAIWTSN